MTQRVHETRLTAAGRRHRALSVDGPTPAVMCLHGTTDSADGYRPLLEALAGRHRTVAVDLRGHGGSDRADGYELQDYAADVIALARQERGPVIVLGHSLGAMIAMFLASRCPGLVAGVVLEDPPFFALLDGERNRAAPWYDGWRRMRELLATAHDTARFDAGVARLPVMIDRSELELGDVLGEAELAARADVLRSVDPAVLDPVLEGRLLRDFDAEALDIRCPAALVAGSWRLGGAMTADDVAAWIRCVPHGTTTVVGGSGHLVHHHAATRRWLLGHLDDVARQAAGRPAAEA